MKVANPTIASVLRSAALTFKAALGLAEPVAHLEAQLLLAHVLKKSRANLISHGTEGITPAHFARYDESVMRRARGEPIAYIVGYREFYSKNFKVSPEVLIPRPETELLVDVALSKLTGAETLRVLDLGTGCGAVAFSIAAYRPHIHVTAVDISAGALRIAGENRDAFKIDNVVLQHSDWFSALLAQRFDLIVTNPPYVAQDDAHLSSGDLRFEPKTALLAGVDGLASLRQIIQEARGFLKPKGWLLVEHGYDQAAAVRQLFAKQDFENVSSCPDLAGILRVTAGQTGTQV